MDDADVEAVSCNGLSCTSVEPSGNAQDVPYSSSGTPDASVAPPASPAKAACGVGSCLPDNGEACVPADVPGAPGSDAGIGPDAGAVPEDPAADAGADAGGEGPNIDGSFTPPDPTPTGPQGYACQLADTRGSVSRVCGAVGTQEKEQACTSSLDCAPGLGCVGPARSGRCLPYCCAEGDTCEPEFYCAERPLRDDRLGEADGPLVPVCVRADKCSLGEQEDCTGPRCVCGPDMACKLVRPDGTTSCVPLPPEPGQAGEACPCDRGYHCSEATEPATCVKTCDLNEQDSDTCGSGVCQATPVLPPGWGICVFTSPDQMNP